MLVQVETSSDGSFLVDDVQVFGQIIFIMAIIEITIFAIILKLKS
jgi:hypothetical protein